TTQGGAQLGQGGAAHDHPAADQGLPQAGLHRVGAGAVAEQFNQDRGIDGDHCPASSRRRSTASSDDSKPSRANLPRAREMASSTLLRRMMRLPSSSTFSRVPLVRPRASRTAFGSVIWPRSATVASMGGISASWYAAMIHTISCILNPAYRLLAYSRRAKTDLSCRRTNNTQLKPSAAPAAPPPSQRSLAMSDSFATRSRLEVGGKSYTYASLPKLAERFELGRLPYSMKILLENLLRHEDGVTVLPEHIEAVANWDPTAEPDTEIAFMPARVVLQDFTGVPCVVDLAAMRDA